MGKNARVARAARREERRAERPERYWICTRWMDGRWGRGDGRAQLLEAALQDCDKWQRAQTADGDQMGLTPHLGMVDHQYRGKVAAVRERAERELAGAVQEQNSVAARIPVVAAKLATAEDALAAFGDTAPTERLARRNSVEKHQPEELIRARNQFAWDGERAPLVSKVESARAELETLKTRWADLDGVIRSRRSLAGRRATKLQEHAWRRHRYYERRLVRRHAEGSRLVTLLNVSRPRLPEWVGEYCTERATPPWTAAAPVSVTAPEPPVVIVPEPKTPTESEMAS